MSRPLSARWALLICVGGLLSTSACDDLAEPTVLTVGSRTFTARDLRGLHAEIDAGQRPSLVTPEERLRFVDRVVERSLLADYGAQLIANGQMDPAGAFQRIRDDALVRRLHVLEGSDVALDTVTVRQAYERMLTAHHVQEFFFAREEDALQARELLESGQAPRDHTKFLDGTSLDTWLTWSPIPDPGADLVADAELGDIVGPVPSRSWWRVLQLVERRPAEQEPYEALRPRILRGLRLRAEVEGSREVMEQLLVEWKPNVHDDAIRRLAEATSRSILRPGTTESAPDWAVPNVEDEPDFTVVEWDGGRLGSHEFAGLVRGLSRGQRPRSSGLEIMIRGVVNDHLERQFLAREARRRGLETDPWVERQIEIQRMDRLIQGARSELERSQDEAVIIDSLVVALRQTQPHLFRMRARARVLRFDLPSRAAAEAELDLIQEAGGGLERLEQMLASQTPTVGGYHLMELTRDAVMAPEITDAVFDSPVGSISGPYEFVGSWVVIASLDMISAREMSDAEVGQALGRRQNSPSAVQQWVQTRSAELGVSVDEDILGDLRPGG